MGEAWEENLNTVIAMSLNIFLDHKGMHKTVWDTEIQWQATFIAEKYTKALTMYMQKTLQNEGK